MESRECSDADAFYFVNRSLVALMASGKWPKFDCQALELMKSSEVLFSGLFNSLAWSRDELAVIALNIFLAVCAQSIFKADAPAFLRCSVALAIPILAPLNGTRGTSWSWTRLCASRWPR